MSIVYSHIPVDLTKSIFKGPYSHIPVNLGVTDIDCDEMWRLLPHDQISFDFKERRTADLAHNEINFDFGCYVPPDACPDQWVEQPGGSIVTKFNVEWQDVPSLDILTVWNCAEKPPVIFSGTIGMATGESFKFEFYSPIIAYMQTGESVDVNLTVPAANYFQPRYQTGESLSTDLRTESLLVPRAQTGESLRVDLASRPSAQIEVRNATGESTTLGGLTTQATIQPRFSTGEAATVSIDFPEPPSMVVSFGTGEHQSLSNLSTELRFTNLNFHSGEVLSVGPIGNEEFYRFHTGESLSLSLATTTSLGIINGASGEAMSVGFRFAPSEGIGRLSAASGENVQAEFSVLRSVSLYPYPINSGLGGLLVDPIGQIQFEMGSSCCGPCQLPDDFLRIELANTAPYAADAIGDCTRMTVSLSTLPRFSVRMATGENFYGRDPNYLGPITFSEGCNVHGNTISYAQYDFALCAGNLIPDADFANVELVSTYDDSCYTDFIFVGESMDVELSNNWQPKATIGQGESLYANLIVDENLRFFFTTGEHARVSNPEFGVRMSTGEDMRLDFYDPPIVGYTGESMKFALTVEYYVEFLENGCLDNEFVPANENGDPDWDKFRPVPVELDRYSHSIKARCY